MEQSQQQDPIALVDAQLDEAIGGGTAAGRVGGIAVDPSDPTGSNTGGIQVALGDGSVRFVK